MAPVLKHCDSFSRRCVWVNGPVIVGAGPAGLSVAACLREQGVPFVILERADCIASLWQRRTYDRLKLHLPKRFCQLPKLSFPDDYPEYPTRSQFVDYLQSYARKFDICPNFNECVRSARYDETSGLWRVRTASTVSRPSAATSEVEYICQTLVVATGENAEGVVPDIEGLSEFSGKVIHACEYKSGVAYQGKKVLVVGCGNSGMEVSLDLCNHGAAPSMVVRDAVHVLPREVLGTSTYDFAFLLLSWLPMWLVDKILVLLAWFIFGSLERYGIRRPTAGPLELKSTMGKTPVLDVGALEKIRAGGIRVVPGIKRFVKGGAELDDGRAIDVDSIVMATGYRSNVPQWLQEKEFSKNGFPTNGWRSERRLYAAGFTRRGLAGLSLDAIMIAQDVGKMWRQQTRLVSRPTPCLRRCVSQL